MKSPSNSVNEQQIYFLNHCTSLPIPIIVMNYANLSDMVHLGLQNTTPSSLSFESPNVSHLRHCHIYICHNF